MLRQGYIAGVLALILMTLGCAKDNTGLPNVIVDIPPISLQNPEYSHLLSPNASAFVNGGIAGIVVYNTGREYVAFDRCSTVNPEKRCQLDIDETGFNLIDPCSGAMFDLATGFPTKPPAKHALKRYYVTLSGSLLYVRN